MMVVREITRYPVKSLQGEALPAGEIEPDGLLGDRRWGILDESTGKILTARRAPELLFGSAQLTDDDQQPMITLPDGTTCHGAGDSTDEALSDWLGKRVRLVHAQGEAAGRAEYFEDATDDRSAAIEWTMPAGRFVDAMPLLLLTTASLRAAAALYPEGDWDVRRFRPNLLIEVDGEGWIEDGWCAGATVRIGDLELRPQQPCIRCTNSFREPVTLS